MIKKIEKDQEEKEAQEEAAMKAKTEAKKIESPEKKQ